MNKATDAVLFEFFNGKNHIKLWHTAKSVNELKDYVFSNHPDMYGTIISINPYKIVRTDLTDVDWDYIWRKRLADQEFYKGATDHRCHDIDL